jgi:RimJ/RimL family protein N-acetyltransferase
MDPAGDAALFAWTVDGTVVRLRPIGPDDGPRLAEGLARLSPETRFARFHYPKGAFSAGELRRLTWSDGVLQYALVADLPQEPGAPLVAVARWVRDAPDADTAEVAYVTGDGWQRRGLGRALVRQLAAQARRAGVGRFRAEVIVGNTAAVKLLESVGTVEQETDLGSGVAELVYRLEPAAE